MKQHIFRCVALLLALCLLLSYPCFADPAEAEKPTESVKPSETEEPTEPDEKIEYVYPNDWSRPALVFAVENGIFAGDENHQLNPGKNITRAEMAAVLVRLLGASEKADLSAFTDLEKNGWYLAELAAAVKAGVFGGTSKSTMEPNAPITREQTIVVLSRAFGIVSQTRDTYKKFTDGGKVSPYARDALSAMKEMGLANGYEDGSFHPQSSITRAEAAQLLYNLFDCVADKPDELPASGRVLYRGSEPLPETLHLKGTLIIGQGLNHFKASDWNISDCVILRSGNQTKADLGGLKTEKLVCAPLEGAVEADATEVWLWGGGCVYTGKAKRLVCVASKHTANGSYDELTLRNGEVIVNGDLGTASCGLGTHLTLSGTADKISLDGKYVTLDGTGKAKLVVINAGDYSLKLSYDKLDDAWYQKYQKDHDSALSTVKTQVVPCKVEKNTALYKTQGGGKIRDLPKGTIVYNEFHPAGSWFYVSCADGVQGWVPRWDCDIPDDPPGATNGSFDYSDATKEGFVDLKGYSSSTNYLVWINRYTQKVYVYTGEKEDWTIIKTFPCSSGANNCPTPIGVFAISSNGGTWNFDHYYVNNVTIFNGDIAFHSILLNYGGGVFDGELGYPKSHGCIRMNIEDAKYMGTLPIGTTVVVY